jgi:hypothetical protein
MHRPYGVAGCLPWQSGEGKIPYGGSDHHTDLLTVAKGLRTFSEGVEEGYVEQIRKTLGESEIILMIGFGFGSINMDLLQVPGPITGKRIFATAYDIDALEIPTLRRKIAETLRSQADACQAYAGCTSAKLFERCRVSFSAL